jgi:hypothetical protein
MLLPDGSDNEGDHPFLTPCQFNGKRENGHVPIGKIALEQDAALFFPLDRKVGYYYSGDLVQGLMVPISCPGPVRGVILSINLWNKVRVLPNRVIHSSRLRFVTGSMSQPCRLVRPRTTWSFIVRKETSSPVSAS